MISHDERIALCNQIMRENVVPFLPEPERAVLMVFPAGVNGSVLTYIANADRRDMHLVLRKLVDKWDADAAAARARDGEAREEEARRMGWRHPLACKCGGSGRVPAGRTGLSFEVCDMLWAPELLRPGGEA